MSFLWYIFTGITCSKPTTLKSPTLAGDMWHIECEDHGLLVTGMPQADSLCVPQGTWGSWVGPHTCQGYLLAVLVFHLLIVNGATVEPLKLIKTVGQIVKNTGY